MQPRNYLTSNVQFRAGRDDTVVTFEQMKELGFHAKHVDSFTWCSKDEKDLSNALNSIAQQTLTIDVTNPYYYIAHYIFDNCISEENVKKKINSMLHKQIEQ